MIKLANDTINHDDIDDLIDWLKTYPRLTKGERTLEFEGKWSKAVGTKYSVFVNSGSSAVLLSLSSLIESGKIKRGDEVVLSALSWSTDFSSIVNLGLKPILCDCNMEDLSFDLGQLEEILSDRQKCKVVLLVTVLGLVPKMEEIVELCERHKAVLLNDSCESLGSTRGSRKIGSYGLVSCYSLYYAHHLSTGEGGVVSTSDEKTYNILKSMRSHGWSRDMGEEEQNRLREASGVSKFDELYTFYHNGYNFRALDLQAQIGIGQLRKLEDIVDIRFRNFCHYRNKIDKNYLWVPEHRAGDVISNFAYPIICKSVKERAKLIKILNKFVECRPLICGSISMQPFYYDHFTSEYELKNSEHIYDCGLYVPNNGGTSEDDVDRICDLINQAAKL